MMEDSARAAKQAQLQKALSTAYLTHQITELETKVRGTTLAQNASGNANTTGITVNITRTDTSRKQPPIANGGKHASQPAAGQLLQGVDENTGENTIQLARQLSRDQFDDDEESDGAAKVDGDGWRVAVIDVSALMWASKRVRALVGHGWEIVVPSGALQTLDLLKKGNSPSAIAARAATRYIEHASRQFKPLSVDPSIVVQLGTNYKRGTGLRIQRDREVRDPEELAVLPLLPGEQGPPKWVLAVLSCGAFFTAIDKAELHHEGNAETSSGEMEMMGRPVLFVANPPLTAQVAESEMPLGPETREMRDQAEGVGNYTERGEGVIISQEAERYDIAVEVLRDEEEDTHRAGRGRRGGRGAGGRAGGGERGRGRGNGRRGGGGGGPQRGHRRNNSQSNGGRSGSDREEVREVKILLRRPASDIDSGIGVGAGGGGALGSVVLPSPSTATSPLPDSPKLNRPQPATGIQHSPGPKAPRQSGPAHAPHPAPLFGHLTTAAFLQSDQQQQQQQQSGPSLGLPPRPPNFGPPGSPVHHGATPTSAHMNPPPGPRLWEPEPTSGSDDEHRQQRRRPRDEARGGRGGRGGGRGGGRQPPGAHDSRGENTFTLLQRPPPPRTRETNAPGTTVDRREAGNGNERAKQDTRMNTGDWFDRRRPQYADLDNGPGTLRGSDNRRLLQRPADSPAAAAVSAGTVRGSHIHPGDPKVTVETKRENVIPPIGSGRKVVLLQRPK